MKIFTWLLRAVLFVLLLVFALQNQHVVELHGLLGARWSAPLVWILGGCLLLGAALGVVAMLPWVWRARAKNKSIKPKASTAVAVNASTDELGV